MLRGDGICYRLTARGFVSSLLQIKRFRFLGGSDLERFLSARMDTLF